MGGCEERGRGLGSATVQAWPARSPWLWHLQPCANTPQGLTLPRKFGRKSARTAVGMAVSAIRLKPSNSVGPSNGQAGVHCDALTTSMEVSLADICCPRASALQRSLCMLTRLAIAHRKALPSLDDWREKTGREPTLFHDSYKQPQDHHTWNIYFL